MALVGGRSTLNPNAPLFIPAAFRQVEDFSPEWWQLVTTSPWYHNYWLSQHQEEDGFYTNEENDIDNIADLLPEAFDFDAGDEFYNFDTQFEEFIRFSESEGEKSTPLHLNAMNRNGFAVNGGSLIQNMKSLEEKSPKFPVEHAKYAAKVAMSSSAKCSPRRIQQPR